MTFILTKHAQKRLKQRNLPDPNGLKLFAAGKKTKRRIAERCKTIGVKDGWGNEIVYFVRDSIVYVCQSIEPSVYKVVTAFDLSIQIETV